MKNPLKQFIDSTDKIHLSDDAKVRMRTKLVAHMRIHPIAPPPYQKLVGILSPYTAMLKRPMLAFAILLFVAVGGATTFAAVGSLPGDPLYPLKVKVIEPAQGLMAVSPKAKAVWQVSIVETRLGEIEELAKKDRLTSEEGTRSKERFDDSIQEARVTIEKISEDDLETADEINGSLNVSLDRHENALKEVEVVSSSTSSIEAGVFAEHIKNEMTREQSKTKKNSKHKREYDSGDDQ